MSSSHLHLPKPKPARTKLFPLSALIAGGLVWSLNPCLLQANGNWWSQPGHHQSVLCCKINLLLLSSAKIHFLKQHNSPSETPSAHLSACPQSCLSQLYTKPSMAAQVCPKAEFKFPLLVNMPFSFYSSYYLFCGLQDN